MQNMVDCRLRQVLRACIVPESVYYYLAGAKHDVWMCDKRFKKAVKVKMWCT
jgi:hypothetical protein